ncbi:metaxin-2 isoform X2 [Labeo rohita]|uniref:Metaxin-2 isoform X2 n=1 Tax=Labeo rohita TaxID=84645 RepID=A0A498NNV7_LABRO|nr:metaxin-2 isoform X2 [Labeo rohita]
MITVYFFCAAMSLAAEAFVSQIAAAEPWPENATLYQPLKEDQILLSDSASSLAVQTFLRMCGLPVQVSCRSNAEYMSPSGKVPFIHVGNQVVSELGPIVQFTKAKVYEDVSQCCQALSQRLGTQPYFFNKQPTELDALVFGHLFTILTTQLTNDELAEKVKSYTNLLSFCHRIEQTYFKEHDRESQSGSSRHSKGSLP